MPSPLTTKKLIRDMDEEIGYNGHRRSRYKAYHEFNSFLPAASAGTSADPLIASQGTGTEVIARAVRGGVRVTTQASTPADGDVAGLIGFAATMFRPTGPLQTHQQPQMATQVMFPAVTDFLWFAGLSMASGTDPRPAANTDNGAGFFFDPANDSTANSAPLGNLKFVTTVASVETYGDTGVPMVADTDYALEIRIDSLRRPHYFVNGREVGVGPVMTTAKQLFWVTNIENVSAAQTAFETRFVEVSGDRET